MLSGRCAIGSARRRIREFEQVWYACCDKFAKLKEIRKQESQRSMSSSNISDWGWSSETVHAETESLR